VQNIEDNSIKDLKQNSASNEGMNSPNNLTCNVVVDYSLTNKEEEFDIVGFSPIIE